MLTALELTSREFAVDNCTCPHHGKHNAKAQPFRPRIGLIVGCSDLLQRGQGLSSKLCWLTPRIVVL